MKVEHYFTFIFNEKNTKQKPFTKQQQKKKSPPKINHQKNQSQNKTIVPHTNQNKGKFPTDFQFPFCCFLFLWNM